MKLVSGQEVHGDFISPFNLYYIVTYNITISANCTYYIAVSVNTYLVVESDIGRSFCS